MPVIPIRNLAERGILTDPQPYDLPSNAFTAGSNVRFEVGTATRAPVFRRIAALTVDPHTVVGYRPTTGFDLLFVGGQDGSITRVSAGASVDVTPVDREPATSLRAWTATFLGDVLYLNRPSHTPAAFLPGADEFVELAAWEPDWRCRSLRAYRDFLFAVNITKTSGEFPSTIKWSDATLAGQMPGSWDPTDLSGMANEVVLAHLNTPLVDALPLRGALIVYAENQVGVTEFTGDTSDAGQNLFVHRPLFNDVGMIAPNCAVEVEGKHYVFGLDDLYVHDATQWVSIANGRVRNWVFRNLNKRLAERCFVTHLPQAKEVMFAFVSGDADAAFVDPTRCNRAAVFNYSTDTWSFVDLPNVSAATRANAVSSLTYATCPPDLTYLTIGGTYFSLADGQDTHPIFAASTLPGGPSEPRLLAYDPMDLGSLAAPYDPEANAPAFLERRGIDMDVEGSELRTYKIVRAILPQVATFRGVPLQITVGASMTPLGPTTWGPTSVFDPATDYKVDTRVGGRYLAIRVTLPEPSDFALSGFDLDVVSGGRR